MAEVFLSLGSNINPAHNIAEALDGLAELFGELTCSRVFESEAVGFDGDNFYNLVVRIDTNCTVGKLSALLRELENECGRDRNSPRFSARSLDVDILTYDQLYGEVEGVRLPRKEILYNAFVLKPLAELAPNHKHPLLGVSYKSLWESFDQASQKLWSVPLEWRGKNLS